MTNFLIFYTNYHESYFINRQDFCVNFFMKKYTFF